MVRSPCIYSALQSNTLRPKVDKVSKAANENLRLNVLRTSHVDSPGGRSSVQSHVPKVLSYPERKRLG